jgi:hypothetical protein
MPVITTEDMEELTPIVSDPSWDYLASLQSSLAAKHLEDARRRPRIGAVVEGDAHYGLVAREASEHRSEDRAVPMPRAVRRETRGSEARDIRTDHRRAAPCPSTE